MKEPIRIKTIDLERKGGKVLRVISSGVIPEETAINPSMFEDNLSVEGLEDAASEPTLNFFIEYDDLGHSWINWKVECEFWKESTEDYEARVLREKQLNDMYNYRVQTLLQELNKAQSEIRQLKGEQQ